VLGNPKIPEANALIASSYPQQADLEII